MWNSEVLSRSRRNTCTFSQGVKWISTWQVKFFRAVSLHIPKSSNEFHHTGPQQRPSLLYRGQKDVMLFWTNNPSITDESSETNSSGLLSNTDRDRKYLAVDKDTQDLHFQEGSASSPRPQTSPPFISRLKTHKSSEICTRLLWTLPGCLSQIFCCEASFVSASLEMLLHSSTLCFPLYSKC